MLYETLKEYAKSAVYPMHMPGHKRMSELLPSGIPCDIDITEIHGFDNLSFPHGILAETSKLAAQLYGSKESFMLVNGSTAGVLSAIGAHTARGDKILMARNCHLSVYNAAALFGVNPSYVMPSIDKKTGIFCSVCPDSIKSALEANPDTKLVIITSPTYEGVISDVASISAITKSLGIPLLVDEAHGAHLGFCEEFSGCAVKAGADIVVMSLHKTLPALTQCGLLHVCGEMANISEIKRHLSIFQTSSPSYLLMASIDHCLRLIASDKNRLFGKYRENLENFYSRIKSMTNLFTLRHDADKAHNSIFAHDPGKVVIVTKNTSLSGAELSEILRNDYKLELEMSCVNYALAMTSISDTPEGLERLAEALICVDRTLKPYYFRAFEYDQYSPLPISAQTQENALKQKGRMAAISEAAGLMSLEYIWAYPPGIPIIAPGEIIDESTIAYITNLVKAGVVPKSTHGRLPEVAVSLTL